MVIGVRSWCEASWRNLRWVARSRAFSSPNRRDSCSAVSLRRACHTMARNMAAMSGTSVSSATDSAPRATSTPMAAPVVAMTAPSTASVGRGAQVRNPYTSVKLIQMKWNGTVSQPANAKIATRLTAENTAHPASSRAGRNGQLSLMANRPSPPMRPARPPSAVGKLIALTAYRLDQAEAELGPQAPHAHVDHVGARVEVVSPHAGQQPALGHRLAEVLRQLAQQQELQPGQRHRPVPDVGDQARHVQRQVSGPDDLPGRLAWPRLAAQVGVLAQPDPDPYEQFGQRERLGQ